MNPSFQPVTGSVIAPRGFLASGVFCDIKRLGTGKGSAKGAKRDLALLVSEVPAVAAGMFTTNQVCAAPVKVCVEHLRKPIAQAIVVNSGNANACTGSRGLVNARDMADLVAGSLDLPSNHVLVASTGRIGVPLPMTNIRRGIRQAIGRLGSQPGDADAAAEAILTSDTRSKQIAVEFNLAGAFVRIGGVAKGAGMIQPGMSPSGRRPASVPRQATMLGFITTDIAVQPGALRLAIEEAVARSFNRVTVDGDMSTNDTVLVLANGLAGNPVIRAPSKSLRPASRSHFGGFQEALCHVCLELAKMIVRDGEGVHRVVTIRLEGARTTADADAAARAVGNSALVKTSWHGGDPNWGRIIDALGYSTATVVEDKVDIGYSAPGSARVLWSLRRGQPTPVAFARLCAAVAPAEFDLHIRLNLGRGRAILYAADLTEAYVDFNKGDLSHPDNLGG